MTERFELLEEVGRGAMGVVWKARDNERGKFVAIKMLRDLHADDREYIERFGREVDLARSVKSPHVVRIRGYGVRQTVPFVVMEFVAGQSLRARVVERGPFPPPHARDLLTQIADALAAVHAVGIVHRDVKASNVLLTEDSVAKLTDFGIARGRDNKGPTRSGSLLGTPAYMAPEGPIDARSDLYSLGVLYYEMLSGVLPFTSTNYQEVILAHVSAVPDLARLPATERGLTGWLMSKDPAGRPQSAAALLASLRSNSAGSNRAPAASQPPSGARPPARPDASVVASRDGSPPLSLTPTRPPSTPVPPNPAPNPLQARPLATPPWLSAPPQHQAWAAAWRPYDASGMPTPPQRTQGRGEQTLVVGLVMSVLAALAIGAGLFFAASLSNSAASGSTAVPSPGSSSGAALALIAIMVVAIGAIAVTVALVMSRTRSSATRKPGPPGPYRPLPPPNPPGPGGQRRD
jgi:serine/threonine-protein kinase